MSIPFEYADMCKGDRCTNLLTASSDAKRGYCFMCAEEFIQADEQDHYDKLKEENKIKEYGDE